MIAYLVLGVLLLAGLLLIGQWFRQAEPAAIARALKWTLAAAAIGLALFLALSGRLAAALAALTAVIPSLLRWHALWTRIKAAMGPKRGNVSTVETARLRMTLDHDSGTLDGEVLSGRFQGRALHDLALAPLVELLAECQASDPQGASLLEAYLGRRFGADWREKGFGGDQQRGRSTVSKTAMTREEAHEILGLEPGAGESEIKAAYHRLMMKLHPDQGGSTYLAAKINQARDLLLNRR